MIINHSRQAIVFVAFSSLMCASSPALAQRSPARAWFDIDDAFITPTQTASSYVLSQPIFGEVATASVSYAAPKNIRIPSFGGGARIYRGFGVGLRLNGVVRQTIGTAITVTVPHPLFVNRPRTAHSDLALDRTERTLDLSVEYLLPMPERLAVRAFAGRSRARISQSLIQEVRYAEIDGGNGVRIENVSEQTASGYAWGSLLGVDVGFFVLRNVGVGIHISRRHADIPSQPEPFTGRPFELSPHRTEAAAGLRLRF